MAGGMAGVRVHPPIAPADPEAMKEMQDMQTQDPQQLISSIFGGSKEEEDDD